MECRSESKVLNLRSKSRSPAEMASWLQSQQAHRLSRRENARRLTSAPRTTAAEQWRDVARLHYLRHLADYSLKPYETSEATSAAPSAAYLFFKTASQQLQPTSASPQLLLADVNRTSDDLLIEVSEVDRKSASRSDLPVTRIILKPLARAKAGQGGLAISSPLSTAYVKRGDYVQIEYLPEATADVGDGGVALSRPELVIHFIDRRRR